MIPLLSLIIPTRNRPAYLLDSVDLALKECPNAEIVVSVNSTTDALRSSLSLHTNSGRVLYRHSSEHLSVVDNFERGLEMSTGRYVMFIGDDDGVGPHLEQVVLWAIDRDVEAVVSYCNTLVTIYFWPGVRSKYFGDAYAETLFLHPFTGQASAIDPLAALRDVSGQFGGGLGRMPRAYHGLVSRKLLKRVKNKYGSVFGGVSPDIYSAALISSVCRRACVVDYPFVIPGASSVSTAGEGAARTDKGKLRDIDHVARFGDSLLWDPRIPEFYSPQTVWAYSLQKALDKMPELNIEPAYGRLFARCLLYYPKYWGEIFRSARHWNSLTGGLLFWSRVSLGVIAEIFQQLLRAMRRARHPRAGGASERLSGLQSISQAYAALESHIRLKGEALQMPIRETENSK